MIKNRSRPPSGFIFVLNCRMSFPKNKDNLFFKKNWQILFRNRLTHHKKIPNCFGICNDIGCSHYFLGAISISFINSSSLGIMMISVLLFSALPETLMLVAFGLYSERPPAVILAGSTPN